jgi:type I restriction enzyme S subunit
MIASLKPYPWMKDSGAPWLGGVPQHWDVLRLKYSTELVNEKVNGAASELPYTGLEHIESWTGKRLDTDAEVSSDGQANVYRAGDVLFGKLRPYLAKAYAAESDGICTSELLILRPKTLLQRFLRDYLLNQNIICVVDSSTYGAKMPRASWDFIGSLPVLIPPLDEQRAIARYLDRETARIDALIEKKGRQIELLHEKRAALISHAVTKGLDASVRMKDSGIDWLGHVAEHWPVVRLGYFAQVRNGSTPSRMYTDYWTDGVVPWLSSSKVNEDVITEPSEWITETARRESNLDIVPSGSVVLGLVGQGRTRGTSALMAIDAAINQNMAAIIPGKRLTGRYLHYQLQHMCQPIREGGRGANQPALNCDLIADLRIVLPPVSEQLAIADHLDQVAKGTSALSSKIETSIDRLREYRTALISAAVTGKIDVREEVNG